MRAVPKSRWALVAVLLLHGAASRADSLEAMRWIDAGECARAGDAINEGIERNEANAYLLAGYLYASTGCVKEDLPRAARYYQRAVEMGSTEARKSLGLMYGLGIGVPQDYRLAYRWYTYPLPPEAKDAVQQHDASEEIAYGYARTVQQLAVNRVVYPRWGDGQEGTVFVTFDAGTGKVTFSPTSNSGERNTKALHRSSPFTNAIRTAYEEAVALVPKPAGLPPDVHLEVPWTFELR